MALAIVVACALSCSRPLHSRFHSSATTIVLDHFVSELDLIANWTVQQELDADAVVGLGDGVTGYGLLLSRAQDSRETKIVLSRRVDASRMRGKRVFVRVHARVVGSDAHARLEVVAENQSATLSYLDITKSRDGMTHDWQPLGVAMDVGSETTSLEISLILDGSGMASFDDLVIEQVLPDDGEVGRRTLSAGSLARVEALIEVLGRIRHFHPSDQAAGVDWNTFTPAAVARILQLEDNSALPAAMTEIFTPIAPTVEFYAAGQTATHELSLSDSEGSLVRWRRIGLGPGSPYVAYREGAGPQPEVKVQALAEVPSAWWRECKNVSLHAWPDQVQGSSAELGLRVQRANSSTAWENAVFATVGERTTLDYQVASDTLSLDVAIQLSGFGSVAVSSVSVECDGKERGAIDVHSSHTIEGLGHSLFEVSSIECGNRTCLRLSRDPSVNFDPSSDVIDVTVGAGVAMRMPLAVWSDGVSTLPRSAAVSPLPAHTLSDVSMRLAAVAATWDVLRWHYPMFDDISVDWKARLRPSLIAAASADSGLELHAVLWSLIADLRDNHANVKHLSHSIDGIVPLKWRRMTDQIIVVGGTPQSLERIPVGSRIIAFDGIPADEAYARAERLVSAATPGYRDFITPFWMSVGPVGTFKSILVEPPDGGARVTVALPCLDRDKVWPVREPRPITGDVLASGIVYVDLEGLDKDAWTAVLPRVQEAQVVIFDLRGYITNVAFDVLGHFTDVLLWSPIWQTPIIQASGTREYQSDRWAIMPTNPRLRAKAIFLVDGRSGSADETLAQIVREHRLGSLVGESTAGTNGNLASFDVPGGFTVRFTGMRVLLADGTSIHAKGFIPEHVVHPTLAGIREGRDEILEAAVTLASGRSEAGAEKGK